MKTLALTTLSFLWLFSGIIISGNPEATDSKILKETKEFICPINGNKLPCPKCCPLNK